MEYSLWQHNTLGNRNAWQKQTQLQQPCVGAGLQLFQILFIQNVRKKHVAKQLLGNTPSPVQLANRVSCMGQSKFVSHTTQKLTQEQSGLEWKNHLAVHVSAISFDTHVAMCDSHLLPKAGTLRYGVEAEACPSMPYD